MAWLKAQQILIHHQRTEDVLSTILKLIDRQAYCQPTLTGSLLIGYCCHCHHGEEVPLNNAEVHHFVYVWLKFSCSDAFHPICSSATWDKSDKKERELWKVSRNARMMYKTAVQILSLKRQLMPIANIFVLNIIKIRPLRADSTSEN